MRVIEKLKRPIQLKPIKLQQATPCAMEISAMFNCWRAMSIDATSCAAAAGALTLCMTAKAKSPPEATSSINEINKWLIKVSKRKQL
ncbi:hypothetical protein BASA61_004011 [Batrachochytrium salamandrivorans]|nr:hypothetical protein BASA61_004011 [Batrachochytrium salamandrivorans]